MPIFDVADGHQLQAATAAALAEAIAAAHRRCAYDQSAWRINRLTGAGDWNAYLAGGGGQVSPEHTVLVRDDDTVVALTAAVERAA